MLLILIDSCQISMKSFSFYKYSDASLFRECEFFPLFAQKMNKTLTINHHCPSPEGKKSVVVAFASKL